jgi:hypothetical protein
MANTKKYKKSTNKNSKRRTHNHSRMSSDKKNQELLYAKNKKRNAIIRNIRMGRSTFTRLGGGGGSYMRYMRKDGYCEQQGGASQFVGSPWTVSNNSNTGNYFAPSPLGVGTGLVPKFDDGLPIYPAKFPTQLGPQVAKLGEIKGGGRRGRSKKYGRKTKTGGGIFDDIKGTYSNIVSSATNFGSKMEGVKPPPSSYPWDQPIAHKNNI